jgi:peptidoglycan/xylan/chitin deacetylase (PgdA/CDA1 family)
MDSLLRSVHGFCRKKVPGRCVVLYYHKVKSDQRYKFSKQMDDLVRWCNPVRLEGLTSIKNGGRYAAVTFDDGYASVIENALPELAHRNIPATLFIPTGCLGQHSPWIPEGRNLKRDVVITEQELKGVRNNLISIGSHCVSHRNLSLLSEPEARSEILGSKHDLERILNTKVRFLSFPYGNFKSDHVKWAREAGYERVFSISPTLVFSNPRGYITGRVRVDPSDWPIEFRLKLRGAYRWLPWAFSSKHKIKTYLKNHIVLDTRSLNKL